MHNQSPWNFPVEAGTSNHKEKDTHAKPGHRICPLCERRVCKLPSESRRNMCRERVCSATTMPSSFIPQFTGKKLHIPLHMGRYTINSIGLDGLALIIDRHKRRRQRVLNCTNQQTRRNTSRCCEIKVLNATSFKAIPIHECMLWNFSPGCIPKRKNIITI